MARSCASFRTSPFHSTIFLLPRRAIGRGKSDALASAQFHSMPQFSYRARNAQGGLVEGVLNVADRSVAIRQIELQNCTPIRIDAMVAGPQVVDGKPAAAVAAPTQNLKIPHGQLLIFTEQLGHLLKA